MVSLINQVLIVLVILGIYVHFLKSQKTSIYNFSSVKLFLDMRYITSVTFELIICFTSIIMCVYAEQDMPKLCILFSYESHGLSYVNIYNP